MALRLWFSALPRACDVLVWNAGALSLIGDYLHELLKLRRAQAHELMDFRAFSYLL
jgi:hypothetical protein